MKITVRHYATVLVAMSLGAAATWKTHVAAQPAASAQQPAIRFVVRPVLNRSLLELDVTVSFAGDTSGRTSLRMPADRFGVPDMHRFVRNLAVSAGGRTANVAGDSVIVIAHAPSAHLSVRYTLRYDSAAVGFVAYGPSVSDRHFHFLGSQWMATVGRADAVRHFEIQLERGVIEGPLVGSFGLGPGTYALDASQDELDWTVMAGGDYREDRFDCAGRPLTTLARGTFEVGHDSIFAVARRVACTQRDFFDDHTQPFYAIVVTARERLRAGASFLNAFACFARPDSETHQLAALLAHEMTHAWLPRKLRLVPGGDEPAPPAAFSWFHDIRYDWFHEGFTEYLSRVLQVRAGLADEDWFVARLNDDIARLAVHPYRVSSAYELEQAALAGRYTNFHQRLSYLRGALLAFRWDAMIQRHAGEAEDLVQAVRRLIAAAAASGGRLERPEFERLLARLGVTAAYDIEHFALGGEPIPVDPLGLGTHWKLEVKLIPAVEPGFDVVASINAGTVIGLQENGPAHAAGLRNGMPIVRYNNAQRWAADWQPDLPMRIVVRQDGSERTIEFNPVRGELALPYFVRND